MHAGIEMAFNNITKEVQIEVLVRHKSPSLTVDWIEHMLANMMVMARKRTHLI